MASQADRRSVRLAELVAALSLGIDLGFGQPMEHILRQCLIALRLAERIGLDEQARAVVYYTALLVGVGCHTDAHEQAKWFGDDIALKSIKYEHGPGPRAIAASMRMVGSGNPPLHRFRIGLEFALSGRREVNDMINHHAALAVSLAQQLGLSDTVQEAVGCAYEQWDGHGWPGGRAGTDVPVAARLSGLADYVEVAYRMGGVDAAREVARSRQGKQFDPALSEVMSNEGEMILSGLDDVGTWDAVIDAEPALAVAVGPGQLDQALRAVANFVDLKSPYSLGHAGAVADLAGDGGRRLDMSEGDVTTLRQAGLIHGLGRLGISNAIWDKPTALGAGEWERVRLHPYLTERMLQQSRSLAPLGAIAVQLRERLDGSGYPRGLSGTAISQPARVLGAADAYQAMREPRPYRPPLPADLAASELRAEVRAGRLDAEAVDAVLAAAGHRIPGRRSGAAGLTPREVEVLRLLARGLSNKQIAAQLVISPKTVGNHAEHIYAKIGTTSRAGAGLFAMQHGLLPEELPAPDPAAGKMGQTPHAGRTTRS
jgi:HD-GYP domain-containing protein (c-di-GMP phosphodiesterase class II)